MTRHPILCGNSRHVSTAPPPAAPPRPLDAPRLRTVLHFPPEATVLRRYRVVGRTADGWITLVCLGATRDETLLRARALTADLPRRTVRVWLEGWHGGLIRGEWVPLRCRRRELPTTPGARQVRLRPYPAD